MAWRSQAMAQPGAEASASAGEEQSLQVIIERAPFSVRDAAEYQIPLKLEPIRQLTLVAAVDGVVQSLRAKTGDKSAAQSELLRLDARQRQLELERAKAAYQAAQQEAVKSEITARVDVAQKDLELAELKLDQTISRMPWDGHILRVHVTEGEFVQAGDPLVTVADQSKMKVEAPIDRRAVQAGDPIELKVEDVTVSGTLTNVVPLSERLDPLRTLFLSIAGGVVEIDNADNRFLPGQTVYSAMIPRQPVGEAPSAAVSNTDDGGRKVQVIRDGMVRDVPVELLGQSGEDYVWVSGRFSEEDELILRTSEPLPDGSLVTPQTAAAGKGAAPSSAEPAPGAPNTTPRSTGGQNF
jgi:multidrug efflux pump subunit AcrA (membrane-fusion protein)